MLQTFKAVLDGNKIQWLDETPTSSTNKPIPVYVTLLEEPESNVYRTNETTLAALDEIESGNGRVFKNVDELFKDLED